MSIDRKTLLERRAVAKRAMHDLDLPDRLRALARRVFHSADALLGMQDAMARKVEREKAPLPASPGASSPAKSAPQPVPESSSGLSEPMSREAWIKGQTLAALSLAQSEGPATLPKLLIDPPGPFSPRSELLAFLREYETGPLKDDPAAKAAVQQVKGYLHRADSSKKPSTTQ